MIINEEIVKGKWLEIKGEIQKTWGKLSADEIEKTKGDIKAIAGLVEQKYGQEQEKFLKTYSEILKPFHNTKETLVENVKQSLKS